MSLKIYFSGSITGGREDAPLYGKIVERLAKYGNVLDPHVAAPDVLEREAEENLTDRDIYERDVAWLNQADVMVAEVTKPSLGVGYEIGRMSAKGKPILCLFRPQGGKRLSPMIEGHGSPAFTVRHYQESELDTALASFFQSLVKDI